MLDEGLDVLAALLTGERVDHHGEHYVVDGVALAPAARPADSDLDRGEVAARAPARRPLGRLGRRRLRRRAQRYTPDDTAALVADLRANGARDDFDVCFLGLAADADLPAYAAAGVTWWIENLRGDVDAVLERVRRGPPGETLP